MPAAVEHWTVAVPAAKNALEAAAEAAADPLQTVALLQGKLFPANELYLVAEGVVWVQQLTPL